MYFPRDRATVVCSGTLPKAWPCPRVKVCPSEKCGVGLLTRAQRSIWGSPMRSRREWGEAPGRGDRARGKASVTTKWESGPDSICVCTRVHMCVTAYVYAHVYMCDGEGG